jgi:hypothetical protein
MRSSNTRCRLTNFEGHALPGGGRRIKNRSENQPSIDVDQFARMPAAYRSYRL